jgi:hypothetical protein
MTIVPTGLPAWLHANDHATYGGDVNKANYQGLDSVNGRTDVSAQEYVRIAADMAAVQRVAGFCTLGYTCNDTVPAVPTIDSYDAMAGTAPTPARNGDGDVTFTWLTSYSDPYGQSGALNIVGCEVSVAGSVALIPVYQIVNAYTVRVRVFDSAGAAVQDPSVALRVYTG